MKIYRVYENRHTGRRIAFPRYGYTNADRSRVRFRRKVVGSCNKITWKVFGTLTYADEFLPYSSKHVSKFFEKWRKHNTRLKVKKDKIEYIWREDFGELKGRPHYHFLSNDYVDHKLAVKMWGRGWVWLKQIYTINEVKRYLYKYMAKDDDKDVEYKERRFSSSKGVPPVPKSDWKIYGVVWEKDKLDCTMVHNQNLGLLDTYLEPKKKKVSK